MSADHKRPLYAFVLVAVLCALIIGNELRGQAAMGVLRAGVERVIPGVALHSQQPSQPRGVHRSRPLPHAATPAPVEPAPSASAPTAGQAPLGAGPVLTPQPAPAANHAASPSAGHAASPSAGHGAGHAFGHRAARPAVHRVVHAVVAVDRHPTHRLAHLTGSRPGHGHGLALGLLQRVGGRGHPEARHEARHEARRSPGRGSHGHGHGPGRGHGHGHR